MTGFLNAHGTSACISGYFLPSSAFEEQDEYRSRKHDWTSVEELASYEPFDDDDFGFEYSLDGIFDEGDLSYEDAAALELVELDSTGIIDLDAADNLYRDFDPIYWGYCRENINIGVVREGAEVFALNIEQFENNCFVSESHIDSFMPSFSSNRTHMYHINWYSEDSAKEHRYRRNLRCLKQAKFRIDGKRAGKSSRNDRIGNRQKFAQLRDYWAEVYDSCEVLNLEYNPPAIPQFGIKVVGLTEEEASVYEAEAQAEAAAFYEALESSWDYHLDEPDDSDLFEDYQHCDDVDVDLDDFDDGPTAEEWAEIDHIFAENDDEEVFIGSFKGLTRTNVIGRQNRSALNRQLMFG